jgi:saccharopine dehydrogenase (NAD+, L-lysine-forming)
VKRFLQWRIERTVTGPDKATRETARTFIWGQVESATGERVTGTLETPEGYAFTVISSVECADRVLNGQVQPGSWTPSKAFGAGLIGEFSEVSVDQLRRQVGSANDPS